MYSFVVIAAIFVAAVYSMVRWGVGRTFAYVYLPAVLFFFLTPPIRLPGLPNMTSTSAVGYAFIGLVAFRWREVARLRFNVLDLLVILMMVPPAISSLISATPWDAISRGGEQFFYWIIPYVFGRMVLHDAEARRAMWKTLCICAIIIGCFTAIEARLRPYAVSRTMERVGLAKTANEQVFNRFGLMRAQTTFGHPIDLGICGVLIGTFILMLGPTIGKSWKEPLAIAGICASGAMVVGAVSFTSFSSLALAFVLLWLFLRPRWGPKFVLLSIFALMLMLVLIMNNMLETQIAEERPSEQLEASVWIRIKIIQDAWDIVTNTGAFGSGKYIETRQIGSGSVDNAYLLFVMQNGWVYLGMWVLFGLVIAWRGMQALARARSYSERFPVAAGMAGVVATLLAMFTVYYGFVYGLLFMVLIGMISSAWQVMTYGPAPSLEPALPTMPPPRFAPRGFAVGGPR